MIYTEENEITEVTEEESDSHSEHTTSDDGYEEWDILKIHNIANKGEEFILPEFFPDSFPIMSPRGKAGFYFDGYLFSCSDETKNMATHHYKCEAIECPAKLTKY